MEARLNNVLKTETNVNQIFRLFFVFGSLIKPSVLTGNIRAKILSEEKVVESKTSDLIDTNDKSLLARRKSFNVEFYIKVLY